jgi:hypothetical protein
MTLEVHKTTAGSPYGGTIRINKQRKTKYARSGNTFFCGIPIILINSQKYIIFIPLNIGTDKFYLSLLGSVSGRDARY